MREYLSTTEISTELGIDRTTVWRTCKKMQKLAGKKGGLSTRCILGKGRGKRIRYSDFITVYGGQ